MKTLKDGIEAIEAFQNRRRENRDKMGPESSFHKSYRIRIDELRRVLEILRDLDSLNADPSPDPDLGRLAPDGTPDWHPAEDPHPKSYEEYWGIDSDPAEDFENFGRNMMGDEYK